jgi:RNase P/RNase MRP subunit p30
LNSSRRMAELLHLAGYSIVAISVPTGLMRDKVSELRHLFEDEGIQTMLRVDLSVSSRADLLRLLRRFRNAFDIVAVKCMNQAVASVACRDRRVDVVFFDPRNFRVKFVHPLASLLSGALEFNLISTFLGETKSEIFSRIAKEASIALEHRSQVVLSSGSVSPAMVRSPLQISAIGAAIGLSNEQSIRGVREIPISIAVGNQERRSREFIEDGVKLVTSRVR